MTSVEVNSAKSLLPLTSCLFLQVTLLTLSLDSISYVQFNTTEELKSKVTLICGGVLISPAVKHRYRMKRERERDLEFLWLNFYP